ncbi:uncharacterized protein LOC132066396 [Lycium ferocissimum]|uniref:uncharacterized protein LOC132066396 n=1 Tax=Lycium ferocissimum TaxID=112874 RepID=UPI0028151EBC|nr:uncharacterized protein LOC132066396 [Lycium ferocissimum]
MDKYVTKLYIGQPSSSSHPSANCLIGLLAPRQILLRFDQYEDFVLALSRSLTICSTDGQEHQYRVFPWSIGFNPKEETTKAVVWISLPDLSPDLFAKKSLLSIASAVGKPIAIDKATQIKSRPSTARVKVILDLLDKLPNRIRLQFVDGKSGKVVEIFQEIVYDNLPLYCNYCKHQGHDEGSCRLLLKTHKNNNQANGEDDGSVEKFQGDLRTILDVKKFKKGTNQAVKGVDLSSPTVSNALFEIQNNDANLNGVSISKSKRTTWKRRN